jgi:hypothetical protein
MVNGREGGQNGALMCIRAGKPSFSQFPETNAQALENSTILGKLETAEEGA